MAVEAIKNGDEWPVINQMITNSVLPSDTRLVDTKMVRLDDCSDSVETYGMRPIPLSIENPSGITPLDLVALVLPDPVETVTKGGIIIPDASADKMKYHTQKATLIAKGKSCFVQWVEKPEVGDRVLIVQYAGTLIKGKDGKEYRIIKEDDLIAGLEE